MNIKIKRRVNPYAQIDRDLINNPELSPQSLGVLVYLLSKPDDWRPVKSEILARFSNSTIKFTLNALESVLRELRGAGYAKITHISGPNGTIFGTEYVISEVPEFKSTEVATSSDLGRFTSVGNVGGYNNKKRSSKEELSNNERLSNSENGNFEKAKALIEAHFENFPDTWKVVCESARLQITRQEFDYEIEKWLRWNEKNIPMMQTITKYITGGPSSLFSWLSRKKEQAYRDALKPQRPAQNTPQQPTSYTPPAKAPAAEVGNNRDLL